MTLHLINLNLESYWIYHKLEIEREDKEAVNPWEKVWLIVKFVQRYSPDGHLLQLDDILKFGRVRFKVIKMHRYGVDASEKAIDDELDAQIDF